MNTDGEAMTDSDKDRDYLGRLQDYYANSRRIPSYARLAELMGFASKTAAMKLLARLEAQDYVERTPDDDAWIPAKRFFERPLADASVPAGMPVLANDVSGEPFYVDDYLIKSPSRTAMIPIRGDSMVDAGINDGDLAVVERGAPAKNGDFVIAIVDNEFTLKELGLERGNPVLKPHNKAYPVIRPQGSLEIYGVMVGLVRRYRN